MPSPAASTTRPRSTRPSACAEAAGASASKDSAAAQSFGARGMALEPQREPGAPAIPLARGLEQRGVDAPDQIEVVARVLELEGEALPQAVAEHDLRHRRGARVEAEVVAAVLRLEHVALVAVEGADRAVAAAQV